MNEQDSQRCVVIIGGRIRRPCAATRPGRVTLIDRAQHHLFQPLPSLGRSTAWTDITTSS